MTPGRVLLVDDHDLVRSALAGCLAARSGLLVVGSVRTAEEALEVAAAMRPDVGVLDIDMPGTDGIEAARKLAVLCPEMRILFLSGHTGDRHIERALDVRAAGYVSKGEPLDVLVEAVVAVASGGTFFSAGVRERLVVEGDRLRLSRNLRSATAELTPREVEVLCQLARGLSKKEVARELGIRVKTVDNHCSHLMEKLAIHDRVELARFAIREGLIDP